MPPKISLIIPCLNDAAALKDCLNRLEGAGEDVEVVVADATSGEACRDVARLSGAKAVHCQRAGRGSQLNEGASAATGEMLVFTHADTFLGLEHLAALRRRMADTAKPFSAGAFYKDIAAHYPAFAWATGMVRLYSRRVGVIYGDQSCFMWSRHFEALGGFAEIPIMEDVELSARLREAGGLAFLDPPLRTSMRRFEKRGYLRAKFQNVLLVFLFRCGLSPGKIYEWYYGRKPPPPAER